MRTVSHSVRRGTLAVAVLVLVLASPGCGSGPGQAESGDDQASSGTPGTPGGTPTPELPPTSAQPPTPDIPIPDIPTAPLSRLPKTPPPSGPPRTPSDAGGKIRVVGVLLPSRPGEQCVRVRARVRDDHGTVWALQGEGMPAASGTRAGTRVQVTGIARPDLSDCGAPVIRVRRLIPLPEDS